MSNEIDMAAGEPQNITRLGDSQGNRTISRRFPRPGHDSILACPVGGVGQIGMNWTLYGHDGQWILVDAGSAFAPREVDGVDAIFPDPRSLRSILPHLSALVVTHAHEDHIGAIHRLWPSLRVPIFATPFASAIIKERLREAGTLKKTRISTYRPGDTLKIGPFSIRTVRMTHSVPECVSLAISTGSGTVFHSGDWKFDRDPVIGKPTDIDALREIGNAGVLGMVCDSTNADRRGGQTTERDVAKALDDICKDAPGMVVLTCFATNVARIASFARAATASGRQVAMSGRSLLRTEQIARQCGLLDGVPEFLHDVRHLRGLDHREMALICTGSQGEPNAAIGRLAAGNDWRLPPIQHGDVVVHSARAIPGNEEDINEILGVLAYRGASIIRETYKGNPVHVTGHAVANELEAMYGLIKPRFAIPVHGEASHLDAHGCIARGAGARDVGIAAEGDVWRISRRRIERVATVQINLLAALNQNGGQRLVPWDPVREEPVFPRKPRRNTEVTPQFKVA